MRKAAYLLILLTALFATIAFAESPSSQQHAPAQSKSASGDAPSSQPTAVDLSYQQAQPILSTLDGALPAELKDKSPAQLEAAWPDWLKQHDAATRARLTRGDEDTLVNFLVLGTSFTKQPRLTAVDFARAAGGLSPTQLTPDNTQESKLLFSRVDDLMRR